MLSSETRLTFDEETHIYRLDGVIVPSVTKILKELALVDFSGIDPVVLNKKAELGTYVHKCCELMVQDDLDRENVLLEARGYAQAFEKFLNEMCRGASPFRILEMEKRVFHPFLRYAGTLDILAERDNEQWIIDIKTGSPQITFPLQTAAYSDCLGGGHKRACLYLSKDGTYRLDAHLDMNDIRTWQSCVGLYHWKMNAKGGTK